MSCETFFVSVRTETNGNTQLFRLCFGLFQETIFLVPEPKQTGTDKKDKSERNKAKQSETNRVKHKSEGTVGRIVFLQLFRIQSC